MRITTRRTLVLVASDFIGLLGTAILAAMVRNVFDPVEFSQHIVLLPFLCISLFINYIEELYDVTPPTLPEEVRSLGMSISLAYFCVVVYLFFFRTGLPSRLVYIGSWGASLFVVPLLRYYARLYFSKKNWWCVPTVFFGDSDLLKNVQEYLIKNPQFGLAPVGYAYLSNALSSKDITEHQATGLKCFYSEESIADFMKKNPNACALVLIAKDHSFYNHVERITTILFSSVIFISEDFFNCKIPLWVRPLEIGSIFCLKVRKNLLDPRRLVVKRAIDIMLSVVFGIIVVPLMLIIALCIKIESSGPVFFKQKRIGRYGKAIWIIKFRTMVRDAEAVLQKTLTEDVELKKEWDESQKLRYDPRITRIGKILRQTSLDELPQIWNVFCGEMSLVGPRPIVEEEIARYGDTYLLYTAVRPGITGLWQVSGRNDLTYEQRIQTDWYYISNWSVWIDILVLFRTVPVIFKGKGAY